MKIRFIAITNTSAKDSDGNSYHNAQITSTRTGKTLYIRDVGGESNTRSLLGGMNYPTLFSVGRVITKKALRDMDAHNWRGAPLEHEVTRDMIAALER